MLVVPDMGGIYISHNKGENWNRVNLYGTVISATYDPNREGVIYAGGAGLYRSTDYGNTFELIFPRKDDIIARLTHNENSLQYYFTKSGIYDRNKYVKNILIDPDDSNHIFILCYSYKKGRVFESKDNGENFEEIFTYTKSTSPAVQFDFNELIYRRETKDIFVINDEKIIGYNLESKEEKTVYESRLGLVDVSTVYENGKTYFIIIEKTDEFENSDTKVYYTNDFENKVDITEKLTSVQPTSFHNNTYGDVTYKYNFSYVSATSLNNIYITNWSYQQTSSIKEYPYTIDGIIRYYDGKAEYLYGNPFRDHNNLSSRAWCDGNTYSLGISASKQNDEEFIFTTLCGVYYAPDNTHIYPKYSTVTEGKYPNAKYVTNGIDEQVTYGVYENPFNRNELLLLNTDLGLIRSEDNGKSWARAIDGIPNKWVNTVYDVAFDERRENYVYSLWSGRHNAPYAAGNETDNRFGGFAISRDSGKTWDTTYSSGLPENSTPVKMSVVYPKNSNEVTIYVATFNEGFFVSYDSGKTFTEMNEGLSRIAYKDEEKYKYIFASDIEVKEGRIFGITAKTSYNGETQPGELYEYINGKWQKIDLPKNVKTPRDIYYHNGILYISGVPTPVWEYKNGTDFTNYGGGVYAYENGEFTQIFDESISTASVQIDSKGTIYISDINGHIYRKEKNKDYQKIYDNYFYISKGLQISYNDDYLYLASHGGGLLKLENLNSLYSHEHQYDDGTITKEATYDAEGEKTYTCKICYETKKEIIPKLEKEDLKDDDKINYTETLEDFENPERGFYNPVFIRYKENENNSVNITNNLVHLRLDIGAFSKAVNGKQDIPLTQNMLDAFDQTLKSIKANGGTAIVRFAYTFEGEKNKEPSLDMILTHIRQICPILTQNKEVIAYIELRFFGPWGEMHSSDVCTTENVSKAMETMLENTPDAMKIGVRQPKYYTDWAGIDRTKLNEDVTVKGTDAYRIGLYNDGYLGSESDLGTFRNREIEIGWLEKQAMHTLYGGEVVANSATGTPLNTTEYMSKEAFRTHTSYLNIAWNNNVIDSWKHEIYDGDDDLYKGQTGYTYIANHLGYRFVLRKSEMQETVKQNEALKINLDIENVGFANLVNDKVVSLVLMKDDEVYEIKTNVEATKWNSREITHINLEEELPKGISNGKWNVYLRISEYGDRNTDNNYKAIRLANNGDMWNETIGANYIGKFVVSEEDIKDIIELKSNTNKIKQGEEVTLSLKLNSDVTANVFKAKINYDSNIWEELKKENFIAKGDWETLKYDKASKEFMIVNNQKVVQNEFLEIKLKAKEDANLGKTKVSIENIIVSNEKEELQGRNTLQELEIQLKKVANHPENPNKPVTPERPDNPDTPDKPEKSDNPINQNNTENSKEQIKPTYSNHSGQDQSSTNNTNNIDNANSENNSTNKKDISNFEVNKENRDNTQSTVQLPKTGANNIFIIILIIMATILSIVLFWRNKDLK